MRPAMQPLQHALRSKPKASPFLSRVHAARVLVWLCARLQPGDRVEPGEVFCEVETDKATVAWESTEEGYLAQVRGAGEGTRPCEQGGGEGHPHAPQCAHRG